MPGLNSGIHHRAMRLEKKMDCRVKCMARRHPRRVFGDMDRHIIHCMESAFRGPAMPWREVSKMDERQEFVRLARRGREPAELCRRFGVSPTPATSGSAAAAGRRACRRSPPAACSPGAHAGGDRRRWFWRCATRTRPGAAARSQHCLATRGRVSLPAPSTVHAILAPPWPGRRAGTAAAAPGSASRSRAPNQLWQMDFKGHIALSGRRPLPSADRAGRPLALRARAGACADERTATVQAELEATFRRYGLPECILRRQRPTLGRGIAASAGPRLAGLAPRAGRRCAAWPAVSPAEPRQERTLPPHAQGRSLALRRFRDLAEVQRAFDRWRDGLQPRAAAPSA